MKIGKVILTGIVCAILLSTLIASVNYNESLTEEKIRIAFFPNIGHAVPIIGMEKGFFENKIGDEIKIETKVFDSGPQVIESLFANSIDIAYVGPIPAINGHLKSQNNNIKIIAGAASGGASFIIHPNSEINTASDLQGKKIAAPQIGNTQDVSLRTYMSENGLKPAEKGGTVIVYNIPNPDIYTLFVKGEIDGAWVAEPWATILETELKGKRLFHEKELWPNNEFASVLLIANTDFVKKNPSLAINFLNSHHETVMWINENPTETRIVFNNFITSHLGKSMSDDVIDIALSNLMITSDPVPNSIYSFAEKADTLGYLGRNGHDLSDIFYHFDTNSLEREETE
ncbi:MAG: ABC transporter substrate-binding protein [Nitrosopumilus sp.]|nr:ABC transporter substrate-binding protein [Nitrosopumilus sp.]